MKTNQSFCVMFLTLISFVLFYETLSEETNKKSVNSSDVFQTKEIAINLQPKSSTNESYVWIPVSKTKLNQVLQSLPLVDNLPFVNPKDNNSTASKVMENIGWPFELLTSLARALPIRNSEEGLNFIA